MRGKKEEKKKTVMKRAKTVWERDAAVRGVGGEKGAGRGGGRATQQKGERELELENFNTQG